MNDILDVIVPTAIITVVVGVLAIFGLSVWKFEADQVVKANWCASRGYAVEHIPRSGAVCIDRNGNMIWPMRG